VLFAQHRSEFHSLILIITRNQGWLNGHVHVGIGLVRDFIHFCISQPSRLTVCCSGTTIILGRAWCEEGLGLRGISIIGQASSAVEHGKVLECCSQTPLDIAS